MKLHSLSLLLCTSLLYPVTACSAQDSDAIPKNANQKALYANLSSDPRLNRKIDYSASAAKIRDVFEELRTYTTAQMTTKAKQITISIHVRDTTIRDVLDGIAAMHNGTWRYEAGKWTLVIPESLWLKDFSPHSEAEAEMVAKGREMLKSADSLTPDLKARLTAQGSYSPVSGPPENGGVMLSQLPPQMQAMAQSIYDYERQNGETNSEAQKNLPSTLPNCRVQLITNGAILSNEEVIARTHQLIIHIGQENRVEAYFNTFLTPDADYRAVSPEAIQRERAEDMANVCEKIKNSRAQALAEDKRMNTPVTLTMEKVTFATASVLLANVSNISFETRVVSRDNIQHTFRFDKTPLHDALDQIAAAYGFKYDGYARVIPADAPEPDYNTLRDAPNKFVRTRRVIMHDGKPLKPHSTEPTTIEWQWRKSGMILFVPILPEQRAAYAAKQKTEKSKSAENSQKDTSSK